MQPATVKGSCTLHLRDDVSSSSSANGITKIIGVPIAAPVTLQQFRDQHSHGGFAALVSSVIECDENGIPLQHGAVVTRPNDVLLPSRHYIVRRDLPATATLPNNNSGNGASNSNNSRAKGVTFSSMATVREYSLSFVSQSPVHTCSGGGAGAFGGAAITSADLRAGSSSSSNGATASLPPGFGVASLFQSSCNSMPASRGGAHTFEEQQQQQQHTILLQRSQPQSQQAATSKSESSSSSGRVAFPMRFECNGAAQMCTEAEFRGMRQHNFVGAAAALGAELDALLGQTDALRAETKRLLMQ